jgi:hypothetical protein
MGKYLTTHAHAGVAVVTVRDGVFDLLPEMTDDSAPLAAEVVAEFRAAVVGAGAVIVDLRRAGELNKRTLNVSFQFARALADIGARRALCGPAAFKTIWGLCKGDTVAPCHVEFGAAVAAAGGTGASGAPDAGP